MVGLTGETEREISASAPTVWQDVITLKWLKGWDNVLVTEPPSVGGEFVLVDDRHRVACNWSRVEPNQALEWSGSDGSSGSVTLTERMSNDAAVTTVRYKAVLVPRVATERVIVGVLKVLAAGKTRKETDKDLADELRHLAGRVQRRAAGSPVDDRAPRQMLDVCLFGTSTIHPDTIPVFDADGHLLLAPGEQVLWTGHGSLAAESAEANSGREQYTTLWRSTEEADLTLTNLRVVWDIRNFVRGDGTWLLVGGLTGAALATWSLGRAAARRSGRTLAGQVRHHQVANLVTGADSRPTFADDSTVTATMIEPPRRVVRVSMHVANGPVACLELTRLWAKAAAADRLRRLARDASATPSGAITDDPPRDGPDDWEVLRHQAVSPEFKDHYHGQLWRLPRSSMLGRDAPYKQ